MKTSTFIVKIRQAYTFKNQKKNENIFMTTWNLVAKFWQASMSTKLEVRRICRHIKCSGSNSYKIWIKSMFIWAEWLIWALQINKFILLNSNPRFISPWIPNSCHVLRWLGIQHQRGDSTCPNEVVVQVKCKKKSQRVKCQNYIIWPITSNLVHSLQL